MVNILLIQPKLNWDYKYCDTPSRALLILGTLAKQRGHNVKILHLGIDPLEIEKPDIVGITCNTFQVKSARQIVKEVRSISKDIKIVIGGPHASAWDGEGQVVIGEGENQWMEILGEKPLNDIPIPDYSFVDLYRFCGVSPLGAFPSTAIMASRGCPFQCTFCNTPVFWGRKVRYTDPQLVLNEVALLHKLGIKEIFFQDDTFNLNHRWAGEIFEGIIQQGLNKEMLFKLACRANEKLVTKEFLQLAYKVGVWNIFYGVESGSQMMLDRMKKNLTIAEIKRAFKMTHEAHINTQASFIVGLPGESTQTLAETAKLINEINPSSYGWAHACPFPGTELDKEVTVKGHKREMDYADYGYGIQMVRTDDLSFEELENFKGL